MTAWFWGEDERFDLAVQSRGTPTFFVESTSSFGQSLNSRFQDCTVSEIVKVNHGCQISSRPMFLVRSLMFPRPPPTWVLCQPKDQPEQLGRSEITWYCYFSRISKTSGFLNQWSRLRSGSVLTGVQGLFLGFDRLSSPHRLCLLLDVSLA